MIVRILFFFLLVFGFQGVKSQASTTCFGCTKVIYIVDNSGSVSSTEFNDMKTSIDQISAQLLSTYTNIEVAVVQYVYDGSTSSSLYDITVPFTNNIATAQTWARSTLPGFGDHLPGSLEALRSSGDLDSLGVLDIETGDCDIRFFVFTDAAMASGSSILKNNGGGTITAPAALPDYGEYNILKTNYNASFSVYHVAPNSTAELAGGAISSVGGTYNTAIDPNPGDPEGSGVLPRRYLTGSFALTPAQINDIVVNLNANTGFNLNFSVFTDDDTICNGDSIIFSSNANAPDYIYWDLGNGIIDSTSLNLVSYYTDSGNYTITHIIEKNGCRDTIVKNIRVSQDPIARFSYDTICLRDYINYKNNSIGANLTYTWFYGDGNSNNQAASSFQYLYTQENTYNVTLAVNGNNGCYDTITKPVEVVDCEVIMPNVFSPNNDNNNETFHPVSLKGVELYNYKIFNRWGTLLYETDDMNKPWNGKTNDGNDCSDGVYYWFVSYQFINGLEGKQNGFLTLVR